MKGKGAGKEKQPKTPKTGNGSAPQSKSKLLKDRAATTKHSRKSGRTSSPTTLGPHPKSPEENVSPAPPLTTTLTTPSAHDLNAETLRLQGKKRRTKECDEAVSDAVANFWDSAWNICTERMFLTTAPETVTVELRNDWLRIVEAEWQDLDMRETPNAQPNRIFKRDEPPLPLAFDTWASGCLEAVPKSRRESVLDPFLRDGQFPDEAPLSEQFEFPTEMSEGQESPEESQEERKSMTETETEYDHHVIGPVHAEDDHWDFDLNGNPLVEGKDLEDEEMSESSVDTVTHPSPETPIILHMRPRPLSLGESTTEVESSSSPSSRTRRGTGKSSVLDRRFSPSQCGGRVGSGVFRLHYENTSEALNRMNQPDEYNNFSSASRYGFSFYDIAQQMIYKNERSLKDDELEVQPLFEDRTPRHSFGLEDDHLEPGHRTGSLALTEVGKKFIKRKMTNLHNRFRRQTVKYFINAKPKPKQISEHHHNNHNNRVSSGGRTDSRHSSAASLSSNNNKKGGSVGDKKKGQRGVSVKYSSHSAFGNLHQRAQNNRQGSHGSSSHSRTRGLNNAANVTTPPKGVPSESQHHHSYSSPKVSDPARPRYGSHQLPPAPPPTTKSGQSKHGNMHVRLRLSRQIEGGGRQQQVPLAPKSGYVQRGQAPQRDCVRFRCPKDNTTTTTTSAS